MAARPLSEKAPSGATASGTVSAAPLLDDAEEGLRTGSRQLLAGSQARFDYVPPEVKPLPLPIKWLRERSFYIFIFCVVVGPTVFLVVKLVFFVRSPHSAQDWKEWWTLVKDTSIPVVSVAFTWWHVWLGMQMCWYPIEFKGIPPLLGWQGIVPRRACIMADRACDLMIGTLITTEELLDQIEPEEFFMKLGPVMGQTCAAVLAKLATRHCPKVWELLPQSVRDELKSSVLEESMKMFGPILEDLKRNANQIFNMKQMAVEVLTSNKALLVEMFQEISKKEMKFVLHVAAIMGFLLGCIQLLIWRIFRDTPFGEYAKWSLPVTGLIIGYFTNWLAITMIFRPVQPHVMCCGYVNVQGVFLKRQKEVSQELSQIICTRLIYARRIMEYIIKSDGYSQVHEIYQRHMETTIDHVVGKAGGVVLPVFVGQQAIRGIKDEVIQITLEEIPHHSREIEEFLDRAFRLNDIIAPRLGGLPPEQFEGMLRPVFKEDEWMVLLLGGVLGVFVGTCQALVLGS